MDKRLNQRLIIGWAAIVFILFVAYVLEVIKHERTIGYTVLFLIITGIPAFVCAMLYRKNPEEYRLRYYIVGGYYLMYLFVLLTGNTSLVFVYILPLLSLLVLYHHKSLILGTGLLTIFVNFLVIAKNYYQGQITVANSRDIEIQIALLFLCFAGSYTASQLYDDIYQKNLLYVTDLNQKKQQIQNMTLQTIETIANAIDAKDEYTQGHSRRVSIYAVEIAREMNLSSEKIEDIRYIALLHDIGKIGIPDAILNKPGRLTDSEYEIMKTHTTKGGEILKDIDTIEGLNTGAKYHHERYDGKGYPNGLKGEEIPLIARIICIADAYDAMTSNRIYRKRLTNEIVMEEIRRCRGTQFDPEVTDAFIACLQNGRIEEALQENIESKADVGNRILKSFMEDQAKHAMENSEKDSLTGVYNRESGMNRIQNAMKEGYGCLLLLNLNEMWSINRKHGFRQGDHYIQLMAGLLARSREGIIVSRFKGDEFLCYVPDLLDEQEIQQFMELIKEKTRRLSVTNRAIEPIKTSIGAVVHMYVSDQLETLIFDASKAVFYVKRTFDDGAYLYQKVPHNASEVSRDELSNLIQLLRQKDNYSQWAILDKDDFKRLFQMISHVVKENNGLGLLMFTVKPVDDKNILVEEREKAILLLEAAILKEVGDTSRMFNYSSMQYIVVVPEGEEPDEIGKNILNYFYNMYEGKKIEVFYDAEIVQSTK